MVYLLLESKACMPVQASLQKSLIDCDVCFVFLMVSCILLRIDGTSEAICVISVSAPYLGHSVPFLGFNIK